MDSAEGSTNSLLKWCQDRTVPYKDIHINNFQSSFEDGNAFVALIHSLSPELFNYEEIIQVFFFLKKKRKEIFIYNF